MSPASIRRREQGELGPKPHYEDEENRMKRWLASAALVLYVSTALGACGSDSDGSTPNAGGEATSSGTSAVASTSVPFESKTESGLPVGYPKPRGEKPLTIGFPSPNAASEPMQIMEETMKAAVEELGGNLVVLDAAIGVDKQVRDIQQLVAQKVDAIVVFPIDPGAVEPAVEQARKAGIPALAVEYNNQDPNDTGPFATQIVQGTDRLAYLEVQQAAEALSKGGSVVQIGLNIPAPTIVSITNATKKWAEAFGLDYLGAPTTRPMTLPAERRR